MQSHYYEVSDPAEAFEKASKDPRAWDFDFATLEAFQAMATALRDGSAVITAMGVDPFYACSRGNFRVAKKPKGFAIAVVSITGHEAGVANPAAAEVLAYHRYHRRKAVYADPLLVHSQHVVTIEQLDAAYALLESTPLRPMIERGEETVTVIVNGEEYQRPTFVVK
jgi:hypothetical protein